MELHWLSTSSSIFDGLWVMRVRNTPNFLPSAAISESLSFERGAEPFEPDGQSL